MKKTKTQQYIEDAVNAAVSQIETKGVEIRNVDIDTGVHIHADEAISVLNGLADAAMENSKTIQAITKAVSDTITKTTVNNESTAIRLAPLEPKPYEFEIGE